MTIPTFVNQGTTTRLDDYTNLKGDGACNLLCHGQYDIVIFDIVISGNDETGGGQTEHLQVAGWQMRVSVGEKEVV